MSGSVRGRVARTVRLVGFVAVVAVVGAACGSAKSSDGAGRSDRWSVSLTSASGQPLPQTELKSGRKVPKLVLGGRYRVNATVPPAVRSKVASKTVVLQHRAGTDGEWTTVKEVRIGDEIGRAHV